MSKFKVGDYVTWRSVPYMEIGYSGGSDEPLGHTFKSDGRTAYKLGRLLDSELAYIMDLEEFDGVTVKLSELRLADSDCHSRVGESWLNLGPSLDSYSYEDRVWFTPEDQ